MSEITSDLVRHLAGLARIDLNEDEVARFTEQLSLIVDSVAKVRDVSGWQLFWMRNRP
ncbi:MAG: aspartyl/glutamyl-tRNA amidotransferase subunit C [Micrococcales bacterium]|nr:aspartyl/glutamyl-tRNA amidotransferase subunit C [Micrococcales bacterium]